MDRVKKLIRLSPEVADQLKEIASRLSISENEAVARAISHYYLTLKGEENQTVSGSIVPISEYQRVRDRLEQAMYKVGELQGQLKVKDELIEELKNRIRELQAKPSRKWWEFWK
jgi:chromosome segregation ATPase